MNQSEYIKILKLARTAIEEYKNWGEEELVVDKAVQIKDSNKKEVKSIINNIEDIEQITKKQENIQMKKQIKQEPLNNVQSKNAEQKLEDLKKQIIECKKCELGQ